MTKTPSKNPSPNAVAVLGAGRLGQAVGAVLCAGGADVRLWEVNDKARAEVEQECRAGILAGARVSAELGEVMEGAGTVIVAVPGPVFAEVAKAYGEYALGDHIVLHAARGVGEGFLLPHDAIRRFTCAKKIGALGGPLYFADLAERRPLFVALGTNFPEVTARIKKLTEGTPVRLHPCADVVGIEVAGAISNVSHLAAGMAEELELGQTARGVLLCRGLSEAMKLGVALGADPATFSGLAGVGDLIPREVSSTMRHDEMGRRLARGEALSECLQQMEGHVEGVTTAREARKKAKDLDLDLPLMCAVADILDGEADPGLRLDEVLDLDLELGGEALRGVRAAAHR